MEAIEVIPDGLVVQRLQTTPSANGHPVHRISQFVIVFPGGEVKSWIDLSEDRDP